VFSVDASAPLSTFVSPTPDDGETIGISNTIINVSLTSASDLSEFKFNWNGTNYTMYNDSLFSMMNFDKQQVISEPSGFFALPAMLGSYSALVTPFCFVLPGAYPFLALCAVGLFYAKSSFSILAALSGVLFFLWFRKRILFWGVGAVLGLFSLVYVIKYDMPNGEFFRRASLWRVVEKEAYQKPLFGHGLGATSRAVFIETTPSHKVHKIGSDQEFKNAILLESKDNPALSNWILENPKASQGQITVEMQKNGKDFQRWFQVHNEFLQAFYELGFVGVFIIGFYCLDIFKRVRDYGLKNLPILALTASFITILITSLGHFPFQVARLSGAFICLLAFLDLMLIDAKKVTDSKWA